MQRRTMREAVPAHRPAPSVEKEVLVDAAAPDREPLPEKSNFPAGLFA